MMHEEPDDRLKNRITDIFENYEDDSAHEGWLLLREKYPPQQKRRAIVWLWWGSAAAVLLVILGVGIWLNTPTAIKNKNTVAINNAIQKHTDTGVSNNISQSRIALQPAQTKLNTDNNIVTPHIAQASRQSTVKQSKVLAINSQKNSTGVIHHNILTGAATQQVSAQQNSSNPSPDKAQNNKTRLAAAGNSAVSKGADSAKLANNTPNNIIKQNTPATIKPMVKEQAHPTFLAKNYDEPVPEKQNEKSVKFGLYAATYFNYAKGSDNEFNVGAGISSEIKLVGRLKLATGIAISQNSLNYNSAIPQAATNYLAASIAGPTTAKFSALATPGILTNAVSPVLKNYQANLVGLDVPINLKYQFDKSDNYISAGLSSGTYINETYQYLYSYPNTLVKSQDTNDKTQSSFSTFDFAKTLNVSFGMGYPLGKKNRLVVEPFLKYPLTGLGAQQLRFGASGVNLKLNFISNKK